MLRKLAVAVLLLAGCVVAPATVVAADVGDPQSTPPPAVTKDDDKAAVVVNDTQEIPGRLSRRGNAGGQRAPDCTTRSGQPGYTTYGPLLWTTQEEQRTQIRPWEQRPGRWAWSYCNGEWGDLVFLPDAQPVDPRVLAESARAELSPPLPRPRTNPSADRSQLVNLRTWLWIDAGGWQPVSATASAGGVTATVTAAPTSVRWEMGDGAVVTCNGPGTPYDTSRPESAQSTDCAHTYKRSSAGQPNQRYTVQVTITYGVSWTVTGAPGGGDLGGIETSESLPLRVAEGQAVVGAR